MSSQPKYVFIVKEEIGDKVKYVGTFDSYSVALSEYTKRSKLSSMVGAVSLQRVAKKDKKSEISFEYARDFS